MNSAISSKSSRRRSVPSLTKTRGFSTRSRKSLAGNSTVRWLELASRVDGEAVEAVSEVLSRVAAGGVVVEPDVAPGADDGFAVGPLATVRAYIPLDDDAPRKQRT